MDTKDRIIEKQKEIIRRRCQHSPSCYINQNWDEARQALADTPEQFRDEGYYQALLEIEQKSNVCTCGLSQLLSELSALTEQGEKENKELSTCDSCGHQNEEICNSCNCL